MADKLTTDKLLEVVRSAGLEMSEQSSYYKCTPPGRSDVRIYVAKSTKAARVDLAGFGVDVPGVKQISEEEAKAAKLGAVRGQLDFSCDPDVVLAALAIACEKMKETPAREPKMAKPKRPRKVKSTVTGAELLDVVLTTEEVALADEPTSDGGDVLSAEDRRQLIREAAAKAAAAAEK